MTIASRTQAGVRAAALTAGAGLLCAATVAAQRGGRSCGTPPRVVPPVGAEAQPSDCGYSSTNPSPEYDRTTIYRIPVVVHVLMHPNGAGALSDTQIRSQIEVLNEDFRARPGTLGAAGFDSGIEFFLATTDPSGAPTQGITRSTDSQWFNDRGAYWSYLAWDPSRYLNVYTNSASGTLGYVPEVPQNLAVGSSSDRVVIAWDAFGRNAPAYPYHLGRTATHEVGHYLGLFHTFSGGCGGASCYTSGDLICDTNPQERPNYGCVPGFSSCGSRDPVNNYMNYSDDACMTGFTREQALRMRCTLQNWRPQVWTSCAIATVTARNAAPNPASYTASRMVIGDPFVATVDVTTTGHALAQVFGALGTTTLPLFNGYVLLADLSAPGGNVLPLPSSPGPVARIGFTVPLDFALCGIAVSSQAIHFGGAPDFALSNAQDCRIGLE